LLGSETLSDGEMLYRSCHQGKPIDSKLFGALVGSRWEPAGLEHRADLDA